MRINDYLNESIFITSVGFSEDSIEVTFLEDRDQAENVVLAKTMVLPIDNNERYQLYAEIQERLCDLIEWGFIDIRNPPQQDTPTAKELMDQRRAEEAKELAGEEQTTDEV